MNIIKTRLNYGPVCTRYDKNPIISHSDMPYNCQCVYNSGAAIYKGKVILLLRVLLWDGNCVFGLAESEDGKNFKIRPDPVMWPAEEGEFSIYEKKGIEDPRITKIVNTYYIFYSAYSSYGFRAALAKTKDFENFERVSLTSVTDFRNTVLIPEKFGGLYARFERPNIHPWGTWISYSPDLIYWGNQKLVMTPYGEHIWEDHKVGPGAPPVKTSEGWLDIYHATTKTMDGQTYRLGAALHDLKDPSKIIGIADQFILSPEEYYERVGYVHNVVFTCGAVEKEKGILNIYYGGADTCLNLATAKISDLILLCKEGRRPPLASGKAGTV